MAFVGGVPGHVLVQVAGEGLVCVVVRSQSPVAQQQRDRKDERQGGAPPVLRLCMCSHVPHHAAKGIRLKPVVALKLEKAGNPSAAVAAR